MTFTILVRLFSIALSMCPPMPTISIRLLFVFCFCFFVCVCAPCVSRVLASVRIVCRYSYNPAPTYCHSGAATLGTHIPAQYVLSIYADVVVRKVVQTNMRCNYSITISIASLYRTICIYAMMCGRWCRCDFAVCFSATQELKKNEIHSVY